jgi:predicted nucleotidyltransferase
MNFAVDFDNLKDYLQANENILLAFVFGSAAGISGKFNTTLSDLDIGILTKEDISILDMGRLIVGLEKITGRKVDLVILNDLYKPNPNFAFNIVSTGRLLFTRCKADFVDFKRNVYLYYLDTKPLIDMFNKSLEKRISTGTFGERKYAC